jgi:hypothetical protein
VGWGGNEAGCGMHAVSLPACVPASLFTHSWSVPHVVFAWVPSSSCRSPAWVPSSLRRVPSPPFRCPVLSSSRPRVGVYFLAPPSPRGRGGDVALSTQGGCCGRGCVTVVVVDVEVAWVIEVVMVDVARSTRVAVVDVGASTRPCPHPRRHALVLVHVAWSQRGGHVLALVDTSLLTCPHPRQCGGVGCMAGVEVVGWSLT